MDPELATLLTNIGVPVISALASYLIVVFKTRTTALLKKLDKMNVVPDFSKYYIEVNGQRFDLADLNVKRKEV